MERSTWLVSTVQTLAQSSVLWLLEFVVDDFDVVCGSLSVVLTPLHVSLELCRDHVGLPNLVGALPCLYPVLDERDEILHVVAMHLQVIPRHNDLRVTWNNAIHASDRGDAFRKCLRKINPAAAVLDIDEGRNLRVVQVSDVHRTDRR